MQEALALIRGRGKHGGHPEPHETPRGQIVPGGVSLIAYRNKGDANRLPLMRGRRHGDTPNPALVTPPGSAQTPTGGVTKRVG